MPVIKHYHGICHVYVDKKADLEMAKQIAINAKCQRPGVCNAMETLLVHRGISQEFLKEAAPAFQQQGVEIRADETAYAQLATLNYQPLVRAEEKDWSTEYLDTIMSLRVVDDLNQAIDHMERYGSHHSDAIVTGDAEAAEKFLNAVDSATVYWNASTRFTDGGEFGFGAEIGISTDKLHARGPMGLGGIDQLQIRDSGRWPNTRMKATRVLYEGYVQGVGFRWTTKRIAQGYEVSGWVRNLADGRVELQVSGEDDEVAAFLRAIRESTLGGHIAAEHATEIELASPFKGFRIV